MGIEPTVTPTYKVGPLALQVTLAKPPRAPWAYPKPEATGNTAVDNQAYRKISQVATDSSEDYPFKPLPLSAADQAAFLCPWFISGEIFATDSTGPGKVCCLQFRDATKLI